MPNTFKLAITVSLLAVSIFISCRKIDFRFKDPARQCRITNITEDFDFLGNLLHRSVVYNEWGNPTIVTYLPDEVGTGNPTFTFEYDSKQRLIKTDGFSTHSYTYNSKGLATLDSVVSNYAGQDSRYEEKLTYDVYGRVIKIVSKYYYSGIGDPDVGTVTTKEFKYDSRGNLIIPGMVYDNKPGIYRTHPVWMFVHRDYSVNNLVGATKYNNRGLPLTYNASFASFLDKPLAFAVVAYDCGTK